MNRIRLYLHRLFRTEETTVASYIRHQRLEGAYLEWKIG